MVGFRVRVSLCLTLPFQDVALSQVRRLLAKQLLGAFPSRAGRQRVINDGRRAEGPAKLMRGQAVAGPASFQAGADRLGFCIGDGMAKSNWYMSRRWQSLRAAVMRRDGYLDKVALRYGTRRPAELVHHIFPREEFPQYQWCAWNLISVSKETHNKLHLRLSDELSQEGIALLRRTARKNNIKLPEQYVER